MKGILKIIKRTCQKIATQLEPYDNYSKPVSMHDTQSDWYKRRSAQIKVEHDEVKRRLRSHDEWLEDMKQVSRTGTFQDILDAARSNKFK